MLNVSMNIKTSSVGGFCAVTPRQYILNNKTERKPNGNFSGIVGRGIPTDSSQSGGETAGEHAVFEVALSNVSRMHPETKLGFGPFLSVERAKQQQR